MYIEKEMMVMFVYDMDHYEEDNSLSSILYFHPSWVSDQHRSLVCNQVVGTMQFLKGTFNEPNLLALQSGKFSVYSSGPYVLALGSDRNIPDWVLEQRIQNLKSLISFFHNNIESIAAKFDNKTQLSEKLYSTFETYVKVLQYSGNMFTNIPTWLLPKSAGNIFLEAMQILQAGQELPHVLGGVILYHNKVIATQLCSKLTRRLIISDPYRIQSPAEKVNVKYILPSGVQLLEVFLSHEELIYLEEKKKQILMDFSTPTQEEIAAMNESDTRNEALVSMMKRDRSLIFTTLPEESHSLSPHEIVDKTDPLMAITNVPKRPKNLNLRLKLTNLKQIDNVKTFSAPSRTSTSVCSTPVANKLLHESVVSIISSNLNENDTPPEEKSVKVTDTESNADEETPAILSQRLSKSLSDLGKDGLDFDAETMTEKSKALSRSINDSTYPVFKTDGTVQISKCLHKNMLGKHLEALNAEIQQEYKEKVGMWKKQYKEEKKQMKIKSFEKLQKKQEEIISPQVRRQTLNLPLRSYATTLTSTPLKEANEYDSTSKQCLTPLIPNKRFPEIIPHNKFIESNARRFSLAKNFVFNTVGLSKIPAKDPNESIDNGQPTKMLLFICGSRDIVMAFILQEEAKFCQELVHSLTKICNETFHNLETQLVQCFSSHRNNAATLHETEPYSYLSVDLEWDSVQRAGPWGVTELGTLTHLHRDFQHFNNITEIIVKNEESVIYGNLCGKTEVFYQQCAPFNAGLPNPTDIMATVSLKARRRLERDNSIILL